ncbi:hypothetical protein, partial [Bacteroides caccae]|uniref:hypothetical protein n=1 Tax=Bacteroides caccae TaxID=47678 RepID=UPI00321A07F0
TCCSFHYSEQDRELQWKEPATGVKKPGHRSGTKERIGEKHKTGEKYGVERRKNRRGGYEK